MSTPILLTAGEVAKMLSIGKSSVWRHVKNGDLPEPVRIGGATRWRLRDIKALIEGEAA